MTTFLLLLATAYVTAATPHMVAATDSTAPAMLPVVGGIAVLVSLLRR